MPQLTRPGPGPRPSSHCCPGVHLGRRGAPGPTQSLRVLLSLPGTWGRGMSPRRAGWRPSCAPGGQGCGIHWFRRETCRVRPSDTCHSGRRWPREGPAGTETWIQSDSQSRVRLDVDFLAELGAGPSPRVFNPLPSGGAGICRWTAVLPAAQVPQGASGSGRPQAPWEPLGCAPIRTAHLTVAAAQGWRVLAHVAPTPSPALPREREPPPSGLSEGWGFGDVGVAAQTAEHTLSLLF